MIFQTYIFWSNKSHNLKFQRFTTLESKDIGIRKAEFVAESQFLWTPIKKCFKLKKLRQKNSQNIALKLFNVFGEFSCSNSFNLFKIRYKFEFSLRLRFPRKLTLNHFFIFLWGLYSNFRDGQLVAFLKKSHKPIIPINQGRTRAFVKGGGAICARKREKKKFWSPPLWQHCAPPLKTPFLKKY